MRPLPYSELLSGLQTRLVRGGDVHRSTDTELAQWRTATAGVRPRQVHQIGGAARRIDALITAGQQSFAAAPDPG